ncbi:hypothetical protein M404DRAFT_1004625 [Pisolithus tinctorius Marx 270]|uniref:Uncharacterized protein n=1 Tax=Pisolithus tinctorius Marx 270 TaxID=870435 RepID=A0A0C3NWF9_PISTI|nr:hypothetical protein M404DRAFT_1004625 [Pisolithus tinctorius Marx 270]
MRSNLRDSGTVLHIYNEGRQGFCKGDHSGYSVTVIGNAQTLKATLQFETPGFERHWTEVSTAREPTCCSSRDRFRGEQIIPEFTSNVMMIMFNFVNGVKSPNQPAAGGSC